MKVSTDTWEWQYLDLVMKVCLEGNDREDRTGVGTRSLFGERLDIDLKAGFPAVTTKKLAWKAVVSELLWMIEGSGDERRLAEILHGTRDLSKHTIWTANAANTSGAKYAPAFPGDLGRVYGVQWRHWWTGRHIPTPDKDGHIWYLKEEVDQLSELIHKLRTNPTDRRMIISAWNVGELDQMALPPCHLLAQFYVRCLSPAVRYLSCQLYQRSADLLLGTPFNVASYALLTHLLASVTGCTPDRLIINMGDCHIYHNHLDGAAVQLNRTPFEPPNLCVDPSVQEIDDFSMSDIKLVNYKSHEAIPLEMNA